MNGPEMCGNSKTPSSAPWCWVLRLDPAQDLPESILDKGGPAGAPAEAFHDAVRESKKQLILSAMEQSSGNYTEAARLLGLHPNYLHRLTAT